MRKQISLLLLVMFLCSHPILHTARLRAISGPVYIVQSGDTLSYIASRFNVIPQRPDRGQPLHRPELPVGGTADRHPRAGRCHGILETEIISFGDSLRSLSRRTQVSDELLIKLNRLVSPTELYVGISLIIPTQEDQSR
jgi:LysM repeat protein